MIFVIFALLIVKQTLNNVASAVKLSGAQQVDVSSGIETSPGINNAKLMSEFVMQANV